MGRSIASFLSFVPSKATIRQLKEYVASFSHFNSAVIVNIARYSLQILIILIPMQPLQPVQPLQPT